MYRSGTFIPTTSLVEPAAPQTQTNKSPLEGIAELGAGVAKGIARQNNQAQSQERQQHEVIAATNKLKEKIMLDDDKKRLGEINKEYTESITDLQEKYATGKLTGTEYLALVEETSKDLSAKVDTELAHPGFTSQTLSTIGQNTAKFNLQESLKVRKVEDRKTIDQLGLDIQNLGPRLNTVDETFKGADELVKNIDPHLRERYKESIFKAVSIAGREQISRYVRRNDIAKAKALYNKHKSRFTVSDRFSIENSFKVTAKTISSETMARNLAANASITLGNPANKNARADFARIIKKTKQNIAHLKPEDVNSMLSFVKHMEQIGKNLSSFYSLDQKSTEFIGKFRDSIMKDTNLQSTKKAMLLNMVDSRMRETHKTPAETLTQVHSSLNPTATRNDIGNATGLSLNVNDVNALNAVAGKMVQSKNHSEGAMLGAQFINDYTKKQSFNTDGEKELFQQSMVKALAGKLAKAQVSNKGEARNRVAKVLNVALMTQMDLQGSDSGSLTPKLLSSLRTWDGTTPTSYSKSDTKLDNIQASLARTVGNQTAVYLVQATLTQAEKDAELSEGFKEQEDITKYAHKQARKVLGNNISTAKLPRVLDASSPYPTPMADTVLNFFGLDILTSSADEVPIPFFNRSGVSHFGQIKSNAMKRANDFNNFINSGKPFFNVLKSKGYRFAPQLGLNLVADIELDDVINHIPYGGYDVLAADDQGISKPLLVEKLDKQGEVTDRGYLVVDEQDIYIGKGKPSIKFVSERVMSGQ